MTDNSTSSMHKSYVMVLMCVWLVACSTQDNSGLYGRLDEIKARPAAKIPSLPIFKPYKTFNYEGSDSYDPFRTFDGGEDVVAPASDPEDPLKGRNLETLELFPLDTLRYVGQLTNGGNDWAIITSPDLIVHRVKLGDHLGKNYGKIHEINEGKILIEELISDDSGGWLKRDAALSLTE